MSSQCHFHAFELKLFCLSGCYWASNWEFVLIWAKFLEHSVQLNVSSFFFRDTHASRRVCEFKCWFDELVNWMIILFNRLTQHYILLIIKQNRMTLLSSNRFCAYRIAWRLKWLLICQIWLRKPIYLIYRIPLKPIYLIYRNPAIVNSLINPKNHFKIYPVSFLYWYLKILPPIEVKCSQVGFIAFCLHLNKLSSKNQRHTLLLKTNKQQGFPLIGPFLLFSVMETIEEWVTDI